MSLADGLAGGIDSAVSILRYKESKDARLARDARDNRRLSIYAGANALRSQQLALSTKADARQETQLGINKNADARAAAAEVRSNDTALLGNLFTGAADVASTAKAQNIAPDKALTTTAGRLYVASSLQSPTIRRYMGQITGASGEYDSAQVNDAGGVDITFTGADGVAERKTLTSKQYMAVTARAFADYGNFSTDSEVKALVSARMAQVPPTARADINQTLIDTASQFNSSQEAPQKTQAAPIVTPDARAASQVPKLTAGKDISLPVLDYAKAKLAANKALVVQTGAFYSPPIERVRALRPVEEKYPTLATLNDPQLRAICTQGDDGIRRSVLARAKVRVANLTKLFERGNPDRPSGVSFYSKKNELARAKRQLKRAQKTVDALPKNPPTLVQRAKLNAVLSSMSKDGPITSKDVKKAVHVAKKMRVGEPQRRLVQKLVVNDGRQLTREQRITAMKATISMARKLGIKQDMEHLLRYASGDYRNVEQRAADTARINSMVAADKAVRAEVKAENTRKRKAGITATAKVFSGAASSLAGRYRFDKAKAATGAEVSRFTSGMTEALLRDTTGWRKLIDPNDMFAIKKNGVGVMTQFTKAYAKAYGEQISEGYDVLPPLTPPAQSQSAYITQMIAQLPGVPPDQQAGLISKAMKAEQGNARKALARIISIKNGG